MKTELAIVIRANENGGFWAEIPAISNCFTQGETIEELKRNMVSALGCHRDALKSLDRKMESGEIAIENIRIDFLE